MTDDGTVELHLARTGRASGLIHFHVRTVFAAIRKVTQDDAAGKFHAGNRKGLGDTNGDS